MRRSFWSLPGVRLVIGVFLVIWIGARYHIEPSVDRQRARLLAQRGSIPATVDLVWPAPRNEMDRRYSFEAGARFAYREYVDAGGTFRDLRLRCISETDEHFGMMIRKEANDPNVVAMLGFMASKSTLMASVITAKRNMLLITPSATWPVLTKHNLENLVRAVPNDGDSARLIAGYMKHKRYKKVGIIYVMTLHGNSIAPLICENARKAGVDVAFVRAYRPSTSPTFPEVLEVIGPLVKRNPDLQALVMIDEPEANGQMLVHLRRAGVRIPIIGSDALDVPATWEEAGHCAEGICFVSLWSVSGASARLQQIYGRVVAPEDRVKVRLPDFVHYAFLCGYDAMRIYLAAAQEAQTLYPRHLSIMLRNRSWTSLYGRLAFSSDGDAIGRHMVMAEIWHGRPREVYSQQSGEDIEETAR